MGYIIEDVPDRDPNKIIKRVVVSRDSKYEPEDDLDHVRQNIYIQIMLEVKKRLEYYHSKVSYREGAVYEEKKIILRGTLTVENFRSDGVRVPPTKPIDPHFRQNAMQSFRTQDQPSLFSDTNAKSIYEMRQEAFRFQIICDELRRVLMNCQFLEGIEESVHGVQLADRPLYAKAFRKLAEELESEKISQNR